jgi:signal transduction histidine kinase/ligand-binding sensor domain-containing protein
LKKLFPVAPAAYLSTRLKRRIQILCLGFALALFLCRHAEAEIPFAVDVWSTEDGLPQSSVIALTQTHDGYLWLGTLNGLVRFDGNSFTRFTVNNTPGLPDNRIVFLFEDSHTNLWVGTETAGLCVIKNGVVQTFPDSGKGGKITCAVEDATGNIWFSAADGRFFAWKDGRLEAQSSVFPAFLFYRAAHLIVPGTNDVIWHLQNGRVEKWKGDRLEKDFGAAPWGTAPLSAAIADASGGLVAGTFAAGIYWLDVSGNWRHLTTQQGLSHDTILSLCFDREGDLWAGTDGGGLDCIKKKFFSALPGLPTWPAQSVAEDAQDGLWVTFNGHGLSHWQTNGVTDYGIGTYSNAWTVLVDNHQQIWAGTRGEGLFRFMSYYFQPVSEAGKVGREIFALFQSRDGKICVGGESGLAVADGDNWNFYSSNDGLPASAVRALADDTNGVLWIGTGSGVFQLRGGKISSANAPVNDISCLLVDHENILWVGTSGHGLARFQNGKWTRYSMRDGLTTDNIGYLVDDDLGNLWIGSYEGVMRVTKKSLADFSAGLAKNISCRTFLKLECGLGAQPAAIRARDGRLWLPTTRGVIAVNPAELQPNPVPPPVIIESVLVDGVEQKTGILSSGWLSGVSLTPDQEQLEIRFASLNFSSPKGAQFGARFKYRLEGRDKNWTEAGAERVAHFTKLPAGEYFFRVIACNEDGVWNETGASLAVTVQPPFWRESWFIVVAGLAVLGILGGIIYLISTAKLKRQLRAARQKELIEKERARIARDLHDQVGANLTQVALLGEMAEMDKEQPGEVELHAQQIYATARETTRSLDEIVWSLNSANDTLEGLANYACKYAQDYFQLAGVSFRSELPSLPATPILPEVRHNVFLAFKEAVNNVVKHAHATEARVKLQLEPDKFILTITDNGRGLGDLSGKQLRNGLKNMRKRLADLGGAFDVMPGEKNGTVVKLTVPLLTR